MTDEWTHEGDVLDEKSLERLQHVIENESDIVVEHRFYRGARSPHRFVCGDYDELRVYLASHARPGDSFYFWALERCCTVENAELHGKVPDARGLIPRGGAY
jgi:hypothetical protein